MTAYIKSKKYINAASSRGTVILSLVILGAIVFLMAMYMVQINGTIGQGYEMSQYQNKLDELKKENKKLEIEVARLQFPANLEEISQNLNLVEIDKVVYLKEKKEFAVRP